jgi:hypothetical protein
MAATDDVRLLNTVNFTGADAVRKGVDWERKVRFQEKQVDGSYINKDMSAYTAGSGGSVRGTFVNSAGAAVFTTGDGTLLLTWLDAANGLLKLRIPNTASENVADISGGIVHIEGIDNGAGGTGGERLILQGSWSTAKNYAEA